MLGNVYCLFFTPCVVRSLLSWTTACPTLHVNEVVILSRDVNISIRIPCEKTPYVKNLSCCLTLIGGNVEPANDQTKDRKKLLTTTIIHLFHLTYLLIYLFTQLLV